MPLIHSPRTRVNQELDRMSSRKRGRVFNPSDRMGLVTETCHQTPSGTSHHQQLQRGGRGQRRGEEELTREGRQSKRHRDGLEMVQIVFGTFDRHRKQSRISERRTGHTPDISILSNSICTGITSGWHGKLDMLTGRTSMRRRDHFWSDVRFVHLTDN